MSRRQNKAQRSKNDERKPSALRRSAAGIPHDDAGGNGERLAVMLRWMGPMIVAATFLAMLIWTWGKWCDVIIDFGRELYTPWRLTQGEVLYRDIAAFYGPLSSYVNALWFALFGVSLQTLSICNAVILGLFTWLLYRALMRAGGIWSAVGGCIVFITVFGLARLLLMGNYNFINPYSHEIVHGMILSFVVMGLLAQFVRNEATWVVAAAGFVYGLVFLTKLEPFVAATLACGAAWLAIGWRAGSMRFLPSLGVFIAAALAVPIVAWMLLMTAMPASDALRGVLGSWIYVTDPELRNVPFFRVVMGFNKVDENLLELAKWLGWYGVVLGPGLLAALAIRWRVLARMWIGIALTCAVAIGLSAVLWEGFRWDSIGRPLPLIMLVASVMALVFAARRTHDSEIASRSVLRLMLLVFAGGMLIKMMLNVRVSHYGFVLAMPASVLFVAMLLDWIPQWITRQGGAGWVLRAVSAGAIMSVIAFMLRVTSESFVPLTHSVGLLTDRIPTDAVRGEVLSSLLDENPGDEPRALRRHAKPDDTMVVMPEGIMLNYLTRMPSTVPYLTFLPPDLVMFSEEKMLRDLQTDPPTFILLVHRNTREFGAMYFGHDYGQSIKAWIDSSYRQIGIAGHEPLKEGARFGVAAFRRIEQLPVQGEPLQRGN